MQHEDVMERHCFQLNVCSIICGVLHASGEVRVPQFS